MELAERIPVVNLCRHRWTWGIVRHIDLYDEFSSRAVPSGAKTEVSGICTKCGKPRVRTIKGKWYPPEVADWSAP